MGSLAETEQNWEIYGRADPMWAALMDPAKQGGRWEADEFFATGESEIATVLGHLTGLGVTVDFSGTALDFGCGVGRLTQALARRFRSVWGIDISSSMVGRATSLNRYPTRCSYLVSNGERITPFEPDTFAFIYTSIVLQHMEPRFAVGYLVEFARLLRPGGTLVFQVPDKVNLGRTVDERLRLAWCGVKQAVGIRTRLARFLRRVGLLRGPPGVDEAAPEMHCVPEQLVCQTLESVGLRLIDIQLTNSTDLDFAGGLRYLTSEPSVGYVSKQYSVVKPR